MIIVLIILDYNPVHLLINQDYNPVYIVFNITDIFQRGKIIAAQ